VLAATLVLVALSRPVARLLGDGFAALDRRVRPRLRRSLFTPRAVLAEAIAAAAVLIWLAWRYSLGPRIGYLDPSIVAGPSNT